jgi:hypothetical protein
MILSPHHQNRIRNLGMSAVYRIAADEGVSVSDVLDLMVTAPLLPQIADLANSPSFTPSQPGGTSRSHAPAAQTDGEGFSSTLPSPPVAPEPENRSTRSRRPGSGDFLPIGKRKEARQRVQAVFDAHPDWTPAQIAAAGHVHVSTAREWVRQMKAGAAVEAAPSLDEREAKLRAMFENGQPTASEAAHALGYIGQGGVRKLARRLGLEFRPVSKAEVADAIRAGMNHTAERTAKAKDETTDALRRATAKPQEAVEPPSAPKVQPEPEQPPAVVPALPVLPPPVVHQRQPQGRFYLRERTGLTEQPRYVHQSLEPSKDGPGPKMTPDRKWAWYDTMERFKGAVKKWPELKAMQKVAANG